MEKITKEDGTEVEVYTADELAKAKTEVLTAKDAEIKKFQEELVKYQEKDNNFKALREAKEKAELESKTAKEMLANAVDTVKTEVLSGLLKDEYSKLISNLAGSDENLKKKLEAEYNRLSDKPTTKEEVAKKVMDAYRLATDVHIPTMNAGVISAASGGRMRMPTQDVPAEEAQWIGDLAAKGGLKLSPDDIKKGWRPIGK